MENRACPSLQEATLDELDAAVVRLRKALMLEVVGRLHGKVHSS